MEHLNEIEEICVSYKPNIKRCPTIQSSLDAFQLFYQYFTPEKICLQETFLVMYLNRSNKVLGIFPLSVGGISGTIAEVRLILAVGLKCAASGIMLAHNHPSGSLMPSKQDVALTCKIKEACSYMDISLVDHLIISPERAYYSFADESLL